MKLGILGGTFDPIHVGHLLTAEIARESLALERVLFVPAGDPPHKQALAKTPAHHRQAMVQQAIADNPHFELCLIDLERPGPHYSVDTIRLIRSRYHLSADECYFIIGADSLVNLPTWHQPNELITLCRLAVVRRPEYQPDLTALENLIPHITSRLDWLDMPLIGLASSQLRQRISLGQSIRYQTPVEAYIQQHQLYKT
jgi:nicotinate-nucleotide adenylyltransferase